MVPASPQIDGSTLRTLCLQHGPLATFHLNLTQGNAVVRYSSKEEAAKAQKSLHMYVFSLPACPNRICMAAALTQGDQGPRLGCLASWPRTVKTGSPLHLWDPDSTARQSEGWGQGRSARNVSLRL